MTEPLGRRLINKRLPSFLVPTQEIRHQIFNEARAVVCNSYERYLGLLVVVGQSKYNTFRSIKERVWQKIQNWKNKFISKPGKEIPIKSVLQAITRYSMSVFKLPKKLCGDIKAMIARF